jgi:hypothetical protein
MPRITGISNPRQKVGHGIGHCHDQLLKFTIND